MTKSQSRLVNVTRQHDSLTFNQAVTHSTSLSNIVDMFFLAGAARKMPKHEQINIFEAAFAEDRNLALKCLFWARDIRGGAGERAFFRNVWSHFRSYRPDIHDALIKFIPEYGRWDDIWYDLDDNSRPEIWDSVLKTISYGFAEKDGLLAKWLPRKGPIFNAIRKSVNMTPKELRKEIVALSNTVEQQMSAKLWDQIEYSHVPSVAMNKYRKAFLRNDPKRFSMYIDDVISGKEEIKSGAIFPHDIVKKALNANYRSDYTEKNAILAQWINLPDYMEGSSQRIIPVCDVSGSMGTMVDKYTAAIHISLSLGLYISERNKGVFENAFITFSASPQMQYLKGDLFQRLHQLNNADWGMNTDVLAVFKLILDRAVSYHLKEEEMPNKVLILSDMEFDYCGGRNTNYEVIDKMYKDSGYQRPQLIFWNLNGRKGNVPVSVDDHGTALVSGYSPALLKDILSGDISTPERFVRKVLESSRYENIHI